MAEPKKGLGSLIYSWQYHQQVFRPFYLCVLLSLFALISTKGEDRLFMSLSTNDGLSQISVLQIIQDSDGFLWFGTRNGLNRYNGYEFEVFRYDSNDSKTLGDNHISSLCEGSDGVLWVGTMNGLNKMNRYTGLFERDFAETDACKDKFPQGMHIFSLYMDSSNRLWIGAGAGLYVYDSDTNAIEIVRLDGLLSHNPVRSIVEDKFGNIYLGTTYGGMIVVDSEKNLLKQYINEPRNEQSLSENFITSLFFDSKDNLWAGSRFKGVNLLRENSAAFIRYNKSNSSLSNNEARCFEEDDSGNILIGTFGGLNVLNPDSDSITVYNQVRREDGYLNHFSIYSIFKDNSGIVWIGSYSGGINYYGPYNSIFNFHDPSLSDNQTFGIVGPMVEKDKYIYIATEGAGLLRYDIQTKEYKYFFIESGNPVPYFENIIKSLYLDGSYLLCGTALGEVYSFDIKTHKFTKIASLERDDVIYAVFKDSSRNLYIGSVGSNGLKKIGADGESQFEFVVNDGELVSFNNVRSFYAIDETTFLIGTRSEGLFLWDTREQKVRKYSENAYFTGGYITSILKSKDGSYWISSLGGGLGRLDLEKGYVKISDSYEGLSDKNVYALLEDDQGTLWMSTLTGIVEFNREEEAFRSYTFASGIRVNEFSPHAAMKSKSGLLYFSGNNGFISFDPLKMRLNPFVPPVYLTDLTVNNRLVKPSKENSILVEPLSQASAITLKHFESNFTISYTALSYVFPERSEYAYKLEGFDDEWIDAKTRRAAFYTNIPPGEYVFKVKASNNDGVWNEEGAQINIKVLSPIWKTGWAFLGYFLILVSLIVGFFWHFKMKEKFKNDLHRKQVEIKSIETFHKESVQLFTSFSHELRTPLTLIYAPLQDLIHRTDLEVGLKGVLESIYRNTERLLSIVNQLMDFRKKEEGKLSLNLERGNYRSFLEEMVLAFSVLSKKRDVHLVLDVLDDTKDSMFDSDLMEKVFFNLLSNSFKNIDEGGKVQITLKNIEESDVIGIHKQDESSSLVVPNYLKIVVSDDGVGVPQENLSQIFDPFFQVKNENHEVTSGTGLGLSLSKAIIELHKGYIWAESKSETGVSFVIILPLFEASGENNVEDAYQIKQYDSFEPTPAKNELDYKNSKLYQWTILIVEDNVEVRSYLFSLLSPFYEVIEAEDGKSALTLAHDKMPDLILSDVMMPVMDGVTFVQEIKKDLNTSHIPVILITARTAFVHIQEGFQSGADDYITKPFSSELLLLKVRNRLQTRERTKSLFSKRFSAESMGISIVSADDTFLQKISEFITQNISNPDLNVELFCQEVGMSRANLYRKMVALTGISANEFIRNFRLETGAKLLKETDLSIAEVADNVGFNSPAYFSTCFKAIYKVSPKDYRNSSNDHPSV